MTYTHDAMIKTPFRPTRIISASSLIGGARWEEIAIPLFVIIGVMRHPSVVPIIRREENRLFV